MVYIELYLGHHHQKSQSAGRRARSGGSSSDWRRSRAFGSVRGGSTIPCPFTRIPSVMGTPIRSKGSSSGVQHSRLSALKVYILHFWGRRRSTEAVHEASIGLETHSMVYGEGTLSAHPGAPDGYSRGRRPSCTCRAGVAARPTVRQRGHGSVPDAATALRSACPAGAGSNLYPVCGGVQVTDRRRPSSAASRATRSRLRSADRPETRSSRRELERRLVTVVETREPTDEPAVPREHDPEMYRKEPATPVALVNVGDHGRGRPLRATACGVRV
jgi:hypothetical protein